MKNQTILECNLANTYHIFFSIFKKYLNILSPFLIILLSPFTLIVSIGATATCFAGSVNNYHNEGYLYSITIPEGFNCLVNSPPSPNHGCNIILSSDSKENIWIAGSYNNPEGLTLEEYLDMWYINRHKRKNEHIEILNRYSASLGGSPGERIIIKLFDEEGQTPTIKDVVVSFRKVEGYGEMVYEVGLTSSHSNYEKNKEVFERIISSWTNDPKL